MAREEVTGATREELAAMEDDHRAAGLFQRHEIPFSHAFCLTPIGKQPDEYDGPQRYCKQRAAKLTDQEWEDRYDDDYDAHDARAYHPACRFHGRSCNGNNADNLTPGFANLKHGMYAENWRLAEDFSESDRQMFEYILSWADIYGWPPQEDDPARYDMLEQFAYDRVRSLRSEDYFEGIAAENGGQSEIEYREEYDAQGIVVGEYPVPNTLSEDLRLLRKDLRDQMKEMGLTPKSRGEMDALSQEASAHEAIGQLASEALSGDHEYDPTAFDVEEQPDEVAADSDDEDEDEDGDDDDG